MTKQIEAGGFDFVYLCERRGGGSGSETWLLKNESKITIALARILEYKISFQ